MLENDVLKSIFIENGKMPYMPHIKHKHWATDWWTLAGFREDEIQFNPRHITKELNKYKHELYSDLINDKHTTPLPTYFTVKPNILTLIALTESAKRDTGEVSTDIDYSSLGDNSTSETEGDTDLTSEISGGTPTYARKQFSTDGDRGVTNQTATWGMMWDDGDLQVAPAISIKEAGLHWHLSDASKIHARVTFTTFTFDAGDLFVISISELHENG